MVSSRVPLIYGAAGFGSSPLPDLRRITDPAECQTIIDMFAERNGYKELDTARLYGQGASEEMLSKLNLRGCRVDTKIFPITPGDHSATKLRALVAKSQAALGPGIKIRTLYLHKPDRDTPFEETLAEVNKLHKEGVFEAFGLSNFWAWEVAQVYTICKENGYILPSVYQGPYSIIARTNEVELFPVLRKFGIRFVGYSPLAGGLLKGEPKRPGGRYDPSTTFGPFQIKLYTQGKQFEALEVLRAAGEKHNISLGELALRWIQHHSLLTPNDGIVFGASSVQQVEENVREFEKGALPEDVVSAAEQAWVMVRGGAVPYAQF